MLSRSSFVAGTEVLTPSGKVAIETLREGDLVIARNEDTGVSGTFPVTALMTRVALDTYWVELARADGTTTRLGVTSEHPMFVVGKGWVPAGDVEAGDKLRDAALGELLVLSAEADSTPRRVHNLEVAKAHTYFAGELEAWGHNSLKDRIKGVGDKACKIGKKSVPFIPDFVAGLVFGYDDGSGTKAKYKPHPPSPAGKVGYACGYVYRLGNRILGLVD